ncbi:MAG: efflux RND transporter permease subunit [Bryobacteraceae bacterium]|nr:efflux RND transporter permease subunit [Bryobacteraceae bacterium]
MQKLAEICIKRPVFATMLILALVVLGLNSYRQLGVDFFPKIELPIVTITTTLRGAAPEEVETQVSKRIEEAVNTISGIEELRSVSSEGLSLVSVQFSLSRDSDVAAQEVRDKISAMLSQLPKDADPPVVEKIATDAAPVVNIAISSPRDPRETTKLADDVIKKNVESINGVGQVKFVGERMRQIQVWLDGNKLQAYGLNVDQVRAALAAQNVEVPGGNIEQGSREMSLRTFGRVERPQDFARLVIANTGGAPVRVSDIGRVIDGFEEPRTLARLDGVPAVVLEVRKQAGTNSLAVIQDVKDRVAELAPRLPKDFQIRYTRDQSTFIRQAFEAVQAHLIEGGLFAAFIVWVFLRSWRSTLITAVAIPTSIVSTYTLMHAMGFTLDQITMLALVMMVGIVIDDAIVVLENIFRKMQHEGMEPMQAAMEGTREIGLAVLATTLSLVIIFMPVALMSGIVGRFMSSFGYTAAFAVMVSLLVSFTMTPMLSSRFLTKKEATNSHKEFWILTQANRAYHAMLVWSMQHRWVITVICLLVMASSVPLFQMVGKDFLPVDDQGEFEVIVRLPPGTSLEGTDAMMARLEDDCRKLPGFKSVLTTVGADQLRKVDRGFILVGLVDEKQRTVSQDAIMGMAREKFSHYKDLIVSVQRPALVQGGGPNKNLMFTIQGPDLAQLDKYSTTLLKKLSALEGVEDVESSYEGGKPELRVRINREKAADLNVSVSSIATALRTLVGGDRQVSTYRDGDDRIDVQLRVDKEFRDSPGALERLYVPSSTLGNVAVSNVASFEQSVGPTQIERYNRQRQIMLTANIVAPQSLSNVLDILQKEQDAMNMAPGYSTALAGASREFGKAASNFVVAFLLSIIFMYMVLASQFESFVDPITILLSLPLSVPFAVLSLIVFKENYQIIYSSVGILVLFGIVKKNSILQIDHIKNLRREGMARPQAIIKGCLDRLRPILMTTAALVAGMIPLALGGGAGSGSRRSVAIIVIGGQTLCLLLTLLVTPVAYSLFDDLAQGNWWKRLLSFFRLRTATAGLIILLSVMGLHAAEADVLETRVGVGAAQRKLTLQAAIEMALASNLEIEIDRVNTQLSQKALAAAQGVFDPFFHYNSGFESRATPTPSVLVSADGRLVERSFANNLSLGQRLNFQGATARVDFNNNRLTTNNPFTGLSPYVTPQLVLSYIQPLLRNRRLDNERGTIQIRRKQADLSQTDFALKAIDVVLRVEQAYWDLVAVREDADVKREAVDLARKQFDLSKRQIEAGTLAAVELSGAEAEFERRRDTYYASLEVVTQAENILKPLLAGERTSALWNEEIIPADQRGPTPPAIDVPQSVETALRQRPELKAADLRQQSNLIQQAMAREATRPQLNLNAGYISAGLAGSRNPAPNPFQGLGGGAGGLGNLPANLLGGYGQSLSNLFGGNYSTFQAGVSLDLTVRNRAAQANVETAVLQGRQLKLEQARVAQLIEAQVRNSLQSIETAKQRITAAEASARAAQAKLDSETRLFSTGESTSFLVLTRQNEYADSRRRAVAARLDLNKAIARYQQAIGGTLESHQVALR